MKYKDKERIVAQAWFVIMANEEWKDVAKFGDIGFPIAYCAQQGIVETKPEAEAFVKEVYGILLQSFDIPDEDYESFSEMNEKAIEVRENE